MGKQIRFFMTRKDETEFLKAIIESMNLVLDPLANKLTFEEAQKLTALSFFIATDKLVISKDKNGFIDPITAEVIHFSRCILKEDKTMKNGKLWAEFRYYDGNQKLKKKSIDLSNIFSKYEKWIKKYYKISKCKDYYIGSDAYIQYKENLIIPVAGPNQIVFFE